MGSPKQLTEAEVAKLVQPEIAKAKKKELQLAKVEQALKKNAEFRKFLDLQKAVNETVSNVWKNVEATMIENNVKQLKMQNEGEKLTLTIAERATYKPVDEVPEEYAKIALDTTKVGHYHKLTGELPEGITVNYTQYLRKTFTTPKES